MHWEVLDYVQAVDVEKPAQVVVVEFSHPVPAAFV